LEELLAIGYFMLQRGAIRGELADLYTPELIEERFVEFGGIMRHVLPNTVIKLQSAKDGMIEAISECDANDLLRSANPESMKVSHFVMQYDVLREGEGRFENFGLIFTSEEVRLQLHQKICKKHIDDQIAFLIKNDELPSFMPDACPKIYEDVIWHQLVSVGGVHWDERTASTSFGRARKSTKKKVVVDWKPFSRKFSKVIYGAIPKYEYMTENVLYVSTSTTFPFVESVIKLESGELLGFQVTRQVKTPAKSYNDTTIKNFMEKVGLENLSNFTFVLIPRPGMADISFLQLDGGSAFAGKKYENRLKTHVVWKVPADYKPSTSNE
jgi:hypothetical protein